MSRRCILVAIHSQHECCLFLTFTRGCSMSISTFTIMDHGIVASVFTGRSCDCSNLIPPGPRAWWSSSWLPGSTPSDKGKLRHLGVPPQGILLCTPGVWVDQASSHDLRSVSDMLTCWALAAEAAGSPVADLKHWSLRNSRGAQAGSQGSLQSLAEKR